jgi:hypothetical protein
MGLREWYGRGLDTLVPDAVRERMFVQISDPANIAG